MGRYTCKDVKFLQSNELTSLDALSLCLISLVPIIIGELSYDASAALTHNSSISLMLARNFRLCVGYGMTTVRGLRTIKYRQSSNRCNLPHCCVNACNGIVPMQ